MNYYKFNISLRIRHPSLDPTAITSTTGISPQRCWKAGEARTTPKDKPLEGTQHESYWTAMLIEGALPDSLPTAIEKLLDRLEPFRDFFSKLRFEGGAVEFFVGWYLDGQSGDVFNHAILARMADLKIDLSLDVFP